MAGFSNLSLTASGLRALLDAQAGATLTLSKIGMGSGTTANSTNLKALVEPKLMMAISEKTIDSKSNYLTVTANMTNDNLTAGFYWKELGLFFKDSSNNDVLFAYACITGDEYDYIPPYSDQRYVKKLRIANIITDAANITVEEAEGLTYVDTITFEEFKEYTLEKLEDKTISAEASGETIVVNNSGESPFLGMKLYGKTTQVTTTGKNLLEVRDNAGSSNGVTVNNRTEDGSVIANGTATANTAFWINTFTSTEDADIILNGITGGSASTYQLRLYDDTGTNVLIRLNDGDSEPYHVTAGTTYRVYVFIFGGTTLNNVVLYPMIRFASVTDPTYEPYTGGKNSPSPEYEQPLESKGKWGNLFGGDVFADKLVEIVSATKNENTKKVSFASNNANDTTPIYGGEFKEKTPYTFIVHGQTNDVNKHANLVFKYTDGTSGTLFFDTNSVDEYKVWSSDGTRTLKGIYTQYAGGITTLNYEKCGIFEGVISLDDFRPYTGQMEIESVVYGKNFLEINTTGGTDSGITYTCNAEKGSVGINGTATAESWCNLNYTTGKVLPKGKYKIFLADKDGNAVSGVYLRAIVNNKNVAQVLSGSTDNNMFEITDDTTVDWVRIQIFSGTTVNNAVVYPMIVRAEETDFTFEPYKAKQSHISLVGDGLKGVPVTDASLATYTDEKGQLIRGDYPDHAKGVFKKYSDIWELTSDLGWVSHGSNKGFVVELSQSLKNKMLLPGSGKVANALCTIAIVDTWTNAAVTQGKFALSYDGYLVIGYSGTLEEFKTMIDTLKPKVQYLLKEPIETPLSASEIASFKALHSNYKVTTVMNDCEAEMKVGYFKNTPNGELTGRIFAENIELKSELAEVKASIAELTAAILALSQE